MTYLPPVQILVACSTSGSKLISGKQAFLLYDTFGFPLELTQELAEQKGIQVSDYTIHEVQVVALGFEVTGVSGSGLTQELAGQRGIKVSQIS